MKCPLLFSLSLLVLTACLDAPTPGAPILVECMGVSGVKIQSEVPVSCTRLEAHVTKARDAVVALGEVPTYESLGFVGGVTIIYRDADFIECRDSICAMKNLAEWHGEKWPTPVIELGRRGRHLLHELFHQADAVMKGYDYDPNDLHTGWDMNGRFDEDARFDQGHQLDL